MKIFDLLRIIKTYPQYQDILQTIDNKQKILFSGVAGSLKSLISASIIEEKKDKIFIFLFEEKEKAAYFYNDLLTIFSEEDIYFFPSTYKRNIQYNQIDEGNIILRNKLISKIYSKEKINAIVTYTEAIIEKIQTKEFFTSNTFEIKEGENLSIDFIKELLFEYHFEYVDFVVEPGQFASRGSIIDIFPFSSAYPYRIDFFGDTVESIRLFNPENQLSVKKTEKATIIPLFYNSKDTSYQSIFDIIPENSILITEDLNVIYDKVKNYYTYITEKYNEKENYFLNTFVNQNEFLRDCNKFTLIEFDNTSFFNSTKKYEFHSIPQPLFLKNFELLSKTIEKYRNEGYLIYISTEIEKQYERLKKIFDELGYEFEIFWIEQELHEGFIDNQLKICLFTDHQIFDRYHKYNIKTFYSAKASYSLKDITDLKPGDYVVHIDYGIGRFAGLQKIEINGKHQEVLRIVYKDNDLLFVNIHSLHKISKYKGKEDTPPDLHKLGSGIWLRQKLAAKQKIKEIARELIELYAKRKITKGYSFSPDTYLQEELEASFIHEDTPDQIEATKAVKADMESEHPMDRLICGDVGYGKTEIAIRAAFKAVADNKQVAVLVPTTLLALQHYNTFSDRLKNFPCKVDFISRIKKPSEQKKTLKELEEGKIDIIIGTHRLLSNDIKFKDLGLLIIDEEQKFGVAAKEKLRKLKCNIDTLTLTATPIPRTFQFSLMGARDLSIIKTPPPNRYPVITEVHTFNEEIIKEGIEYEINRGGQVFFINNWIKNIYEIEKLINKICPKVKTVVAHGQMDGKKLEEIMMGFINGDYDVLISTAIIESGLDIPNANTIFINNAHQFGLSDLHQLRGRVGRSNKKAFCYLLAPPLSTLTSEARRRLKAIEEFSELGSGFNIALYDLDIRGAGNLLGPEQSGFIVNMGFETYNKILEETIQELKENEFKEIFTPKTDEKTEINKEKKYVKECQIDTDLELLIPDYYIPNHSERINIYKKIDNLITEKELKILENEIIDRFGNMPEQLINLFKLVRLRWKAMDLGFEKIVIKNNILIATFISDKQSDYYKSEIFEKIIKNININSKKFKLKQLTEKLTLHILNIKNVDDAIKTLDELEK